MTMRTAQFAQKQPDEAEVDAISAEQRDREDASRRKKGDAAADVQLAYGQAAEQGVAGYDVRTWAGILAPKGLPQPIVERLHAAIAASLAEPEVKTRLETIVAGTARARKPDDMRAMVANEVARWRKVVADAGIPKQ